jgi:putative ABC transport system permease protein
MDTLLADLKYAVRSLRNRPGFALVVVVTLALGAGVNTAMFSMINGLLLHPVNIARLDRVVEVTGTMPAQGLRYMSTSPADYVEWKRDSRSFQPLAAYTVSSASLAGKDSPRRVQQGEVSGEFFPLVQARPLLGRVLVPADAEPGRDGVVLLSHALWKSAFGGDRDVLGRHLSIDGRDRVVVGVLTSDFDYPRPTELWTPLVFTPAQLERGGSHFLVVMGRLAPGATIAGAQAELSAIAGRQAKDFPATNAGRNVSVMSLAEASQAGVARAFCLMLLAAGFLVLLTACANVANLLLARASSRRREVAIRGAMGASGRRILRQLLTECVLLSLIGSAAGFILSIWTIELLRSGMPAEVTRFIPGWNRTWLDGTVFLVTLSLALLTGLLFGLAPALDAAKVDLNDALKEGARGSSGASGSRARRGFVIAQVALALTLVASASLVVKGFKRLVEMPGGFDSRGVLVMRASLPDTRYGERARQSAYARAAVERLSALPGATSAVAASHVPWADWGSGNASWSVDVEGRAVARPADRPRTVVWATTPGYYRTLRIPIVAGRDFGAADGRDTEPVAIVSRTLARRLAPRGEAVGLRIRLEHPRSEDTLRTVVGVVGDVTRTWWEPEPPPLCYLPVEQAPITSIELAVRTDGDPLALAPAAQKALMALDPELPIYGVSPLSRLVTELYSPLRISALMMGFFGVLALVLAAVGVYGVIAYSVSQRTHEIGVRLALGAARRNVMGMVIRQGMTLAAIGVAIGLPMAFGLNRLAAHLLYGVVSMDVVLLLAIALALVAVAFVASYVPARDATRVDPMTALRAE